VISKEEIPKRNPKKEIASQFRTPLILMKPVKKIERPLFFFSDVFSMIAVMSFVKRCVGLYEY
jgi:hypothetical protein